MKVIVLTGMPGSGKSAALDVAKGLGLPVYRMGDAVWDEVRSRGHELDKELVGQIAHEMRERHGPAIWAERTIEMVKLDPPAPLVIIDGCRSKAEIDAFKLEWGEDLQVLAIHATEEIRYQRLRSRARVDDIGSMEEFQERDARELKWGIGEVMLMADRTIDNDGPLEDTQKRLIDLLRTISSS